MDDHHEAIQYSSKAFKVLFGLGLILALVIFTPLGGWLKDVSAGLQISTVSFLKQGTGTELTLDDGLVGHWTFDGGYMDMSSSTKEVLDRSSESNHGNWQNHATTTVLGRLSQAIEFDGNDDYIEIYSTDPGPLHDAATEKTLSAWVKLGNPPTGPISILEEGGSSNGLALSYRLNTDAFAFSTCVSGSVTIESDSTFLENHPDWVHVTGTYNSGLMSLYINGVLEATSTNGTAIASHSGGTSIGGGPDVDCFANNPWVGNIDDARIYNRSLSASEVQELYQLGTPNTIAETSLLNRQDVTPATMYLNNWLIGHWTFDGPYVDWSSSTAEVKNSSGLVGPFSRTYHGNATTTMSANKSVGPGVIGQAMYFDGNEDLVDVGEIDFDNYSAGNEMTFATWFKIENITGSTQRLVSQGGTTPEFQLIVNSSDKLRARVDDSLGNSDIIESDTIFEAGVWYHVAWTYNTGTIRMFINGVEEGTVVDDSATGAIREDLSAPTTAFGSRNDTNASFNGYLDDIRIYEKALSPAEILELYRLGQPAKVASTFSGGSLSDGLELHYTFDGKDIDLASPSAEIKTYGSFSPYSGDWQNHATTTVIGKLGQAIEFDGVDDVIYNNLNGDGSDNQFDGPLTIAVWAKIDTGGTFHEFAGKLVSNGAAFNVFNFRTDNASTPKLVLVRANGTASRSFDGPEVTVGEWRHYAVTTNTSEINSAPTFYVDGVATVGSALAGSGTGNAVGADAPIRVGYRADGVSVMDGAMDDLRIYSRALTAEEVQRLYQMGN